MKSRRIIDSNSGAAYNVFAADINNDGVQELIASNHEGSESNAKVWIY